MKKILVVMLTVLGASLSANLIANQGEEDQLALMELERDYMALLAEPQYIEPANKTAKDEPDCD